MTKRKHVLMYRNGVTTEKPSTDEVYHGEVAVAYKTDNEKLYTKNSNNAIVEFSADHIIHDRIDEQDEKVSDAIGLTKETSSEDGKMKYQYTPSNTLLNECLTMNDSVEYLAGQVQNCLSLISEIKSNVYMIDVDFEVSSDVSTMINTITWSITYNGNPTTVTSAYIKKENEDGQSETLASDGGTSGSLTTDIESSKEIYTIIARPNLDGALPTKIEESRYLCYIGCGSITEPTSTILDQFNKVISDGKSVDYSVTSVYGDYIWICVPSMLNIALVTSDNMPITLSTETVSVTNTYGDYTCYRSANTLDEHTWNLVIKHVN